MMNTSSVLDKIIADKCKEVAQRKSNMPIAKLEATEFFKRPCFSLKNALQNSKTGIIAEYKRRSPSKAIINQESTVRDVAKGYSDAGACGMSVLTDEKYFGGTLDDLTQARAAVQLPLLRKEFVIDEYQLVEAKAYGADVVLLIAAALSKEVVKILSETANNLGLEVLLEIHNEEELQQSPVSGIDMIGVNNRNLKTFDVTLEISKTLARHIPDTVVKVSESGISSIEAVKTLQAHGYRGFLIGEYFMRTENPGASAKEFIAELSQ